ncbi:enoyl-CoA hydratase-related protein [Micrococcaceae bacterium Sec5.1]
MLNTAVIDLVLVMTMNRPGQRDTINRELVDELLAAHVRLDEDRGLHVGVLATEGSNFCAGMDRTVLAGKIDIGGSTPVDVTHIATDPRRHSSTCPSVGAVRSARVRPTSLA